MEKIPSFCYVIRSKIQPSKSETYLFPKESIRVDIFNGETDIEINIVFADGQKSSPIQITSNGFYSFDVIAKGLIISNLNTTITNNIQIISWINSEGGK